MISKTIEKKIMEKVVRRGRGTVFFGTEFLDAGHPDAVRQALSRLARTGTIRRIGTAFYHYPAINNKLGGELPPSADAVAQAVARRTGSRIVATGALAANLLGLSTQVPAKRAYLTNGPSRSITVGSYSLNFRHVSPRRMAVSGEISAMVFEALRYLKRDNSNEEVVKRLRQILPSDAKAQLCQDLRHATLWMRPVIERIINKDR